MTPSRNVHTKIIISIFYLKLSSDVSFKISNLSNRIYPLKQIFKKLMLLNSAAVLLIVSSVNIYLTHKVSHIIQLLEVFQLNFRIVTKHIFPYAIQDTKITQHRHLLHEFIQLAALFFLRNIITYTLATCASQIY